LPIFSLQTKHFVFVIVGIVLIGYTFYQIGYHNFEWEEIFPDFNIFLQFDKKLTINDLLTEAKYNENNGELPKAILIYEQILELDHSNFKAWTEKIRITKQIYDDDIIMSTYDQWINSFATLRDSDKGNLDYSKIYLEALKGKAEFSEEIKDFRGALEAYEKMLKLDKFDTEILKKKAYALEKLEEFRLAKQTYEFISSLEPNNVEIQSKIQELSKRLNTKN